MPITFDNATKKSSARHGWIAALLAGVLAMPSTGQASVLEQISPAPASYLYGIGPGFDFYDMSFSAIADVTAPVSPVDIVLGLGNITTSGCEAADFAGFPAGNIALIQRGTCTFAMKATNAYSAGAAGVLIFNQGNTAARLESFAGSLGADFLLGIPVLALSYDLGVTFAATPGLVVHMVTTEFTAANPETDQVPEPGTLAILAAGLLGLAAARRRRNS